MTVNVAEVAEQVYQRYPFFRLTFFERRMLFERDLFSSAMPEGRDHRVDQTTTPGRGVSARRNWPSAPHAQSPSPGGGGR